MLRLTLTPHILHFKRPAPTSRGPLVLRNLWIVQALDSRQPAIVGMGECGPIPGLSCDATSTFPEEAAALVESINRQELSLPVDGPWQTALDCLLAPFDPQLVQWPSLAFGVESALIDLHHGGGGAFFDSPFAEGVAPLPTHGLIWMDTPKGQLAQVDAKVAAGFSTIKMKIGALPIADELAMLDVLRSRHPSIDLRLDANGAFTPEEALRRIEALAPIGVEFLEQPVRAGQLDDLRRICAESPMPIALDEELIGITTLREIQALLELVRPQAIIIKPSLIGGWRMAGQVAALCEHLGITWWANSLLESSIGHDAICQWTAASGGVRVHGLGTGGLFRNNFRSPIRLAGSVLQRDPFEISSALRASPEASL